MANAENEPELPPEVVRARTTAPGSDQETMDPSQIEEASSTRRPALLALIVWLSGFLLLLAFLIWGSIVELIRWLSASP